MSRSICLTASIPFANNNRSQPAHRRASHSIPVCSAITTAGSATYTTSTSSADAAVKLYSSYISVMPSVSLLKNPPSKELGLVSVLFVLSAVFGAFVSLGLLSLPAMLVLKRLERSGRRLDKVVAQEVPGTLLSLKLSSMEIGRVAQILSSIRGTLSGGYGELKALVIIKSDHNWGLNSRMYN